MLRTVNIITGSTEDLENHIIPFRLRDLIYNYETHEWRKGPGLWQDCAPSSGASSADLSVRLATTTNITLATGLNAGDTIDGVVLAAGDLVLVKNHATAGLRGIYTAGVTPARTTGYTTYDALCGLLIHVQEGSSNAGLYYLNTDDTGGTIDSTAVDYLNVVPMSIKLEERLQYSNAAAKSVGAAADLLLLEDSAEGGVKKRMSLEDLKTSLAGLP